MIFSTFDDLNTYSIQNLKNNKNITIEVLDHIFNVSDIGILIDGREYKLKYYCMKCNTKILSTNHKSKTRLDAVDIILQNRKIYLYSPVKIENHLNNCNDIIIKSIIE